MYLDLNARFYLLRRLFFRRASQNVVSPGQRPDAPARVLLCAHYDAARTGAVFAPKRSRGAARLARRLAASRSGPSGSCSGRSRSCCRSSARGWPGVDSDLISLLQLIPTLVLLVGVFLLVDIELSDVVPGANDNASGRRDRALARRGARREAAREPRRLGRADRRRGVPAGGHALLRPRAPRASSTARPPTSSTSTRSAAATSATRPAPAGSSAIAMDRRLVELCEAIATADREDADRYQARPLVARARRRRDAAAPRAASRRRRSPASNDAELRPRTTTRLDDTPDRIDPAALDRAHGFALELVRALDRDVGRRHAPVI